VLMLATGIAQIGCAKFFNRPVSGFGEGRHMFRSKWIKG
jgi:hypothetical protein